MVLSAISRLLSANAKRGNMKKKPLIPYLILITLLSAGFIIGMKLAGKAGNYLAGAYMLGPAIAAAITRLFFYEKKFRDAHLGFGKLKDYLRFWGITMVIVLISYVVYTVLGSISWDFSGDTFLTQLKEQMALSGQNIDDLPAGMTPQMMLIIFFVGGLTLFNIPMTLAGFGEEFGWRGILFPQLCRTRLITGFIVGGLIWFAWHIPLTLVMPNTTEFTLWQQIANGLVLAVGSIFTFVFFAYVYVKSGTIWVAAFVHAVFNNGARSFAYFATVENQLLANVGLALTMLAVVAFLYFKNEFAVFEAFLNADEGEQ
jgi:membrane protease YdiL (CAAX protease family)